MAGFDLRSGEGFLGKWMAGWLGAWLHLPVLGHWFERVKFGDIYLVPALIGAFVGAFTSTTLWNVFDPAWLRRASSFVAMGSKLLEWAPLRAGI